MVKVQTDDDGLQWLYRELAELDRYSIEIGIFGSDNKDENFYAIIANVHEFGMTIKPVNGKNLAIPVHPNAIGKNPKDFADGELKPMFSRKNGISKVWALGKENGKDGELEPYFILKKSVNIPERSFIRSTFDEKNDEWMDFLEKQIEKLCEFEIDARTVFQRLGAKIVGDIQEKIRDIRTPKNSPLTIENKGFDNPLIHTGSLRRHVTWKLVRDDGEYV